MSYDMNKPVRHPGRSASADWKHRVEYHKPSPYGVTKIASVREAVLGCGQTILREVPVSSGRELALALTTREEAMMWAIAGVARDPEYMSEEQ